MKDDEDYFMHFRRGLYRIPYRLYCDRNTNGRTAQSRLTHTAAHVVNIKESKTTSFYVDVLEKRHGAAWHKRENMTKKELGQYRHLKKECAVLEQRIRKRERDAENVPTVKDKVQTSQKDFPYVEAHLTVDAPEPKQYSAIQRDLYNLRHMKAAVDYALAELDGYISRINDSRARLIITYVYVEEHTQKQAGIEFDLTESAISKIISKTLQEFN